MNSPFSFLSALATRQPWMVVAVWVLLLLAAAPFALRLDGALTKFGWDVDGSQSKAAHDLIELELPQTYPQNLVVVFHSDETDVDDPRFGQVVDSALARIEGEDVVAGYFSFFSTGNRRLVSEDGHTTYAVVGLNVSASDAPEEAPDLMGRLRQDIPANFQIDVTGAPAMWADFNDVNREAMFKGEALAFPVVMLVLVLVFGSLAATGLPLVLTMGGLLTTFAVMYGLGQVMPVAIWGENFAMMIGMGVGVDYALFVVTRFRQELQQGKAVPEAVKVAMDTAGKAVFFSGLIVVLALIPVLLVPVVALRSMGLGMIIAVAVVLAASFTLLPALLSLLGARVNRWRLPLPKRWQRDSAGPTEAGFWHRWATTVMKRPVLAGGLALAVLGALAAPALGLKVAMPGIRILPEDTTARQGFERLVEDFGPGEVAPINVVVERPSGTVFEAGFLTALDRFSEQLTADAEVMRVESIVDVRPDLGLDEYVALYKDPGSIADPQARSVADGMVNRTTGNDVTLVRVYPRHPAESDEAKGLVDRIRDELSRELTGGQIAEISVGGVPAENQDMTDALVGRVPLAILAVLILTYVLLVLVLRSVVLPAQAVLLNLLSVFANYGILVVIFQHGFGQDLLGFDSQGFVNAWSPLLWFALLFGLSMDYEMFLLSSVKERYEQTGDNEMSVAWALERTARPISSAAVAMVAVFGSFALAGTLPPKEMGTGMAIAIAIDATLVRLVLVPAAMRILGRANWWLPGFLDRRLPAVSFGHGGPPEPALVQEG